MADIKYYDVILSPVITEKSMNAMKNCSLNLTGQKLNMNQHRHDTNRFRISSKP